METLDEKMLTRRSADLGEDPDLSEPSYIESVRRYQEKQRKVNRARWYSFHVDMSELYARLSQEHADIAERLCCEDGDQ